MILLTNGNNRVFPGVKNGPTVHSILQPVLLTTKIAVTRPSLYLSRMSISGYPKFILYAGKKESVNSNGMKILASRIVQS